MSQQEEQNSETLIADFEFVENEPIDATFSIMAKIGDLSYIHYQDSPQSTWTINHNLNKYPSVTIVDSAENVVYGDITYVDANSLIVEFTIAFAGKAYLN